MQLKLRGNLGRFEPDKLKQERHPQALVESPTHSARELTPAQIEQAFAQIDREARRCHEKYFVGAKEYARALQADPRLRSPTADEELRAIQEMIAACKASPTVETFVKFVTNPYHAIHYVGETPQMLISAPEGHPVHRNVGFYARQLKEIAETELDWSSDQTRRNDAGNWEIYGSRTKWVTEVQGIRKRYFWLEWNNPMNGEGKVNFVTYKNPNIREDPSRIPEEEKPPPPRPDEVGGTDDAYWASMEEALARQQEMWRNEQLGVEESKTKTGDSAEEAAAKRERDRKANEEFERQQREKAKTGGAGATDEEAGEAEEAEDADGEAARAREAEEAAERQKREQEEAEREREVRSMEFKWRRVRMDSD